MGTPLETEREFTRTPAVRLHNVGDWIDVAIVDLNDKIPMREYGSNEVMIGQNGKPRTQQLVVGMVLGCDGAVIPDGEGGEVEPKQGDLVAIFLAGGNRWAGEKPDPNTEGQPWLNAKEIFRAQHKRGLITGDILRWHFEAQAPSSRAGNNDRKKRYCTLFPADDERVVAKCDELHQELRAERAGNAGTSLETDTEEAPFDPPTRQAPPGRSAPPKRSTPPSRLSSGAGNRFDQEKLEPAGRPADPWS